MSKLACAQVSIVTVASAAGVIGVAAFALALVASFWLPSPQKEDEKLAREFGRGEALDAGEASMPADPARSTDIRPE